MKTLFAWVRRAVYLLVILIALLIIIFGLVSFFTNPSNDRNWNNDQRLLPHAEVRENLVSIYNVRNFTYASTTSYTENYYDKTYDLNTLKKVWYVVEPFSGIPGSAHTFLSFEFENNTFVSISVEIRKEKGEKYSPIKGLFNNYELMYVVADERDVIKLRSNYRKDSVFVYPVKTEKGRELFVDMINRVNKLKTYPEFYNSITNNCTTNIVHHINTITPGRAPFFNINVILPENSDRLAYELGLLDTTLSFEDARKRYYINDRAQKYANDPNFSVKIRQEQ